MYPEKHIPPPLIFNQMKHHLGFIRHYISVNSITESQTNADSVIKEIRHLGGSVMDVYTGSLTPEEICQEITENLKTVKSFERSLFAEWAGKGDKDFKVISISDSSQWTLKYFDHEIRYMHLFPARYSPHSFRIKANSLKSAILYQVFIGKDLVTENDLNKARWFAGLSPLKDIVDAEAISEMIEILRG
jgi:hypothetical protein